MESDKEYVLLTCGICGSTDNICCGSENDDTFCALHCKHEEQIRFDGINGQQRGE